MRGLTGRTAFISQGNTRKTKAPTPVSGRTFLLAGGAFAVGTSAYVVAGVLPQLSSGLGVSVSAAGQLATAFALAYAIGAPLVATLTGRWNRRTLLVVALLTAAAGNVLVAIAPTYWLVLLGRVVAALGAAAYTPAATLVATRFHPPHQRGRAVAVVFAGLTLALALGVPAGTILGGPLGYRGVFLLVAGTSALAAVGTRLMIPSVEAPAAVPLRERLAVATWGFNPPFQHLLLDTAGEQGGLALALNASAIYLGAGLSGVLGGLVIAGSGIATLPLVGAAFTVVTSVVFVVTDRRLTRSERTTAHTLPG